MTALNQTPGARYLSIARVCDKLSRRKTWLYDQIKNDATFPKPRLINGRKAFVEHELDGWVNKSSDTTGAVRA